MRYCCFRFDADTHQCVAKGIPNLVRLADRFGVKFTFFVNMGRAFDRRISIGRAVARLRKRSNEASMPAARKLGLGPFLRAAILNPKAGLSYPQILKSASEAGHEIGLHGGRNHARWERDAHRWGERRLRDEIQWGIQAMERCRLKPPVSFASPAWNSPDLLPKILPAMGFRYLADIHDPDQAEPARVDGALLNIPTNITGGDSGIGYFEFMRLRGLNATRVAHEFEARLRLSRRMSMVYDHPFYAGVHALDEVSGMIRIALDLGFIVTTISEAMEKMTEELPRNELAPNCWKN